MSSNNVRLGGHLLGPPVQAEAPGQLVAQKSLPDWHFFRNRGERGSLRLYATKDGYKLLRVRERVDAPEATWATFLDQHEDPYELAHLVRTAESSRRADAERSELRHHDVTGTTLTPEHVARYFPELGLSKVPPAPLDWVKGYSIEGASIFATSASNVDLYGAAIHTQGYTCLLDFEHPRPTHELFEVPEEATRYRIADFHPPTEAQVLGACRQLDAWLDAGKQVVTHCLAGKGRTGTVLACYLAWKHQLDGDEAIGRIRAAAKATHYGKAVETPEQEECVRAWARKVRAGPVSR